ncbi:uncharacterized protein DNG_09080 [Cephalotrichum gorgonifer]|uniref:MYND-type domain-containing protein n=1 Tax=Cephalotrichum gorgonifer TaxID=2041049 RepID=A0AAE8SYY5_9PEZI|nr:uncharacterized protein DNG_09080 [Cephalotrichum gorgonifer]
MSSPADSLRPVMSSPTNYLRLDMLPPAPGHLKGPSCEACDQKCNLQRCTGCLAVYYCGRAHQASDRANHKKGCVAVRRAREYSEREALGVPDGAWRSFIGDFHRFTNAQEYLSQRCSLANSLLRHFGERGGRVAAVEHLIPSLYVSLGRDQEAYDFLKLYAYTSHALGWPRQKLPFLEPRDSDVLEDRQDEHWTDGLHGDLNHAIPLLLVKVRVLLELRAIQSTMRAFAGTLPPEIISIVCRQLVDSTALASRPEVLRSNPDVIGGLIRKMKAQIREIYRASDRLNHEFWRFMFNEPEPQLYGMSNSSSFSTRQDAISAIIFNRPSWCSTPGALETILDLRLAVWCPRINGRRWGWSDPAYYDPY